LRDVVAEVGKPIAKAGPLIEDRPGRGEEILADRSEHRPDRKIGNECSAALERRFLGKQPCNGRHHADRPKKALSTGMDGKVDPLK